MEHTCFLWEEALVGARALGSWVTLKHQEPTKGPRWTEAVLGQHSSALLWSRVNITGC